MKVRIERLCGWHGFEFDRRGYVGLGYWLVSFGDAARARDQHTGGR